MVAGGVLLTYETVHSFNSLREHMPIGSAAGAPNLATNDTSVRSALPFTARAIISGGLLCRGSLLDTLT